MVRKPALALRSLNVSNWSSAVLKAAIFKVGDEITQQIAELHTCTQNGGPLAGFRYSGIPDDKDSLGVQGNE